MAVVVVMAGQAYLNRQRTRAATKSASETAPPIKLGSLGRQPSEDLGNSPGGAPAEDRRLSPRRAGNPTSVLFAAPDAKGGHLLGIVIDRSSGGLHILVDKEVKACTKRRVRAVAAPEEMPWVSVQVIYCRKAADGWHVGCKFEETPSIQAMLLFG
ncbi:MAG: PilZ domain-containing protein [Gemmataceae bacterium]|nr:PilZ domain-containing protein [Gemmataceae bacterium]